MIRLFDADTDAELGTMEDADLEIVQEQLVEETTGDYSYNITPQVLRLLEDGGASKTLLTLLRRALGSRPSMEIRYEPD